jgi:hypothetical protein
LKTALDEEMGSKRLKIFQVYNNITVCTNLSEPLNKTATNMPVSPGKLMTLTM